LDDISFAVNRGEAVGIVGSNGAGKSTILKMLTRILRPTHGTVRVRGRLSALIEVGAGFHPDLTGRENVFLNGTIMGMRRAEIRRKLDEIVEFAGLAEFLDTPVKRYSSGMYARLGFAVAAHVEPDLLIVDEVLSVGDHVFQQKCLDRMTRVLKDGTTVLFVSHNLRAVADLCPRSILLEKGRILADGATAEVLRSYVGREQKQGSDQRDSVELQEVVLRDASGESVRFESGDCAYVDVTTVARRDVRDLAIIVEIADDRFRPIFETCCARLNEGESASLSAGEHLGCTFELDLHLAAGTYHVNVYAYQYSTNRAMSTWRSAASFLIGQTRFAEGHVNLYPRLGRYAVGTAPTY
jgi:lipopolysaccharide transport system ATP-binding protein